MSIQKQIASVEKMHGGTREQTSKHVAYLQWLNRRNREMFGADADHVILKKEETK